MSIRPPARPRCRRNRRTDRVTVAKFIPSLVFFPTHFLGFWARSRHPRVIHAPVTRLLRVGWVTMQRLSRASDASCGSRLRVGGVIMDGGRRADPSHRIDQRKSYIGRGIGWANRGRHFLVPHLWCFRAKFRSSGSRAICPKLRARRGQASGSRVGLRPPFGRWGDGNMGWPRSSGVAPRLTVRLWSQAEDRPRRLSPTACQSPIAQPPQPPGLRLAPAPANGPAALRRRYCLPRWRRCGPGGCGRCA